MARSVLLADVNGMCVQGRPRLGWMGGVKVALRSRGSVNMALGGRGMSVKSPQCPKYGRNGETWCILFYYYY